MIDIALLALALALATATLAATVAAPLWPEGRDFVLAVRVLVAAVAVLVVLAAGANLVLIERYVLFPVAIQQPAPPPTPVAKP